MTESLNSTSHIKERGSTLLSENKGSVNLTSVISKMPEEIITDTLMDDHENINVICGSGRQSYKFTGNLKQLNQHA